MKKILFVCHGNICRSPMAEYLFKDTLKNQQLENKYYVESAGVSSEEKGNPVHYKVQQILNSLNIDCSKKRARKITSEDYKNFDYIIGMDRSNKINLMTFYHNDPDKKIYLLLDFTSSPHDVIDPWYYGNFEQTYNDIEIGLKSFLNYLEKNSF